MPLRSKLPVDLRWLALVAAALLATGYLLGRLHAALRLIPASAAVSAPVSTTPEHNPVDAADRLGLAEERKAVAQELGRLQAQLERQAQDLAFYRSIATTTAQAPVTLQQLRLQPGSAANRYLLSLVLGRPLRREDPVSGTVILRVEGQRGGVEVAQKITEFGFNYRYLQQNKLELVLPPELRPARLIIELQLDRPHEGQWRQVAPWVVEPV